METKHFSQLHYPLDWPIGYSRSIDQMRSRFNQSFFTARIALEYELEKFGGRELIISSNLILNANGSPKANGVKPGDKGVAVYFTIDKKEYVFACDYWNTIECNLYAIALTIKAMRGIDRWAVSSIIERAFQGFLALPESSMPISSTGQWWKIIGVKENADAAQIKTAIRNKKKIYHPDGSAPDRMKYDDIVAIELQLKSTNKI